MPRLRNLAATAILIALVAFLFTGCGGEETTPPAKTSTQASTSRSSASRASGGTSTSKAENLTGQVVVPGEQTPNEVRRSLESRRPIVISFFITGPYDDQQVRSYVNTLESKYKGQVDFYDYLYTDGQRYGDLVSVLGVNTTPCVVVINKQSQVQRAWTGYVDAKSIEQGIVEATKS